MVSDLEHYREHLHHVVRPESPVEREKATSLTLRDYEALYLRDALMEFAAYEAMSADEEGIALAYADYVAMVIRDEGRNTVDLYAHTEGAKRVLRNAIAAQSSTTERLHTTVHDKITETFGDE